jgi:hypothetical protein
VKILYLVEGFSLLKLLKSLVQRLQKGILVVIYGLNIALDILIRFLQVEKEVKLTCFTSLALAKRGVRNILDWASLTIIKLSVFLPFLSFICPKFELYEKSILKLASSLKLLRP